MRNTLIVILLFIFIFVNSQSSLNKRCDNAKGFYIDTMLVDTNNINHRLVPSKIYTLIDSLYSKNKCGFHNEPSTYKIIYSTENCIYQYQVGADTSDFYLVERCFPKTSDAEEAFKKTINYLKSYYVNHTTNYFDLEIYFICYKNEIIEVYNGFYPNIARRNADVIFNNLLKNDTTTKYAYSLFPKITGLDDKAMNKWFEGLGTFRVIFKK